MGPLRFLQEFSGKAYSCILQDNGSKAVTRLSEHVELRLPAPPPISFFVTFHCSR
jgi:hypothetical protein